MQTKDPMSKGGCFGGAGTIRRYPEVRLIPFALKWSQEKSSVTATLLQRAESEPETCCDSHICCPDLPRPGFGPQWNNTPPSSHCGRGQRGVTERNVDRLKCDMKCVSNIKPREGVHIIQPVLQLMNGCYLHSYYLSCIQICEKAAKRNNKTREKPTLFL